MVPLVVNCKVPNKTAAVRDQGMKLIPTKGATFFPFPVTQKF